MASRSTQPTAPRETRAFQTRESIERAALEAFSEIGFDAARTRDIAERAGVKQQLITYHYGSKLALWKAVADDLFSACRDRLARRAEGLEGVEAATRVRLLVREFLLFSAEHPELARFMMHEGARPGPRLTWLYERYTREFFELARDGFATAQAAGLAPQADPAQLTYVLLGATAVFSQAAEFSLMTGRDSCEPAFVESHVDLVVRLLLPGCC